jgi:hypothetical protein
MVKATAKKLNVEQRQQPFTSLNRWIVQQGAVIISAPGSKRVRFTCAAGSSVPERLGLLGFQARYIGPDTRVTADGITPVDIHEVSLG